MGGIVTVPIYAAKEFGVVCKLKATEFGDLDLADFRQLAGGTPQSINFCYRHLNTEIGSQGAGGY